MEFPQPSNKSTTMLDIQSLFTLGMKRYINSTIQPGEVVINLGSGNSPMQAAINLDLPDWEATRDWLSPFADEAIDTIFAFHFLEHLTGEQVIKMLRDCERVLKYGGTMNIVVPHRLGSMAFQDIDHKSFFTEETFRTLFDNPYYDKNREFKWKLAINYSIIMGVAERNLAVVTQLYKWRHNA